MHAWQMFVVLMAVSLSIVVGSGCAGRQPHGASIEDRTSIERPARPLSDEEGLADKIGEIGIVLLVVGIAVGGILVPILFLF